MGQYGSNRLQGPQLRTVLYADYMQRTHTHNPPKKWWWPWPQTHTHTNAVRIYIYARWECGDDGSRVCVSHSCLDPETKNSWEGGMNGRKGEGRRVRRKKEGGQKEALERVKRNPKVFKLHMFFPVYQNDDTAFPLKNLVSLIQQFLHLF